MNLLEKRELHITKVDLHSIEWRSTWHLIKFWLFSPFFPLSSTKYEKRASVTSPKTRQVPPFLISFSCASVSLAKFYSDVTEGKIWILNTHKPTLSIDNLSFEFKIVFFFLKNSNLTECVDTQACNKCSFSRLFWSTMEKAWLHYLIHLQIK